MGFGTLFSSIGVWLLYNVMLESAVRGSELVIGIHISGNGNQLQYSCLENPMDREAWWATVHGVTEESDMTEHSHTHKDTNKLD